MKVNKHDMGDESGGKPESRFHYLLKSRRHILIIPLKPIWVTRIFVLFENNDTKSPRLRKT